MKRTAAPTGKPFEFRVGVGMPGFRGMRTVGDPCFMPPIQFRYLQNVRLGEGDVKNRPGLVSVDSLDEAAIWLTEISDEVQTATLFVGPNPQNDWQTYSTNVYMLHAYTRHDMSRLPPSPGGWDIDIWREASSLYGVLPKWDLPAIDDGNQSVLAPCGAAPYIESEGLGPLGRGSPVLGWEQNDWNSGIHSLGFFQCPVCLDPVVKWTDADGNDRWLAAGHYRGDRWSGVGDYCPPWWNYPGSWVYEPAEGNPDVGGQALVEINFDTKNPLDRAVLLGNPAGTATTPLYGCSINEIVRMPPPGYKKGCQVYGPAPVPTANFDATMYPNCEWIRSMVSVRRRADDPLTTEEITRDTVYIGTAGGKVKAIDAGGPAWKTGINDCDDGDVWAFDGVTLEKVKSGVGQMVCVAATPDGGVLAAGRTAAYFLPEPGASWVSAPYNPGYTAPPGGASYAAQFNYGFFWTSRVVFQGVIYLYGYDIGAGFIGTTPSLDPPARLVIARFNTGTGQIDIIRTGANFDQVVVVPTRVLAHHAYVRVTGQVTQAVLATDGSKLFYLNRWGGPYPPDNSDTYIGEYDGVTWNDDAYSWLQSDSYKPVDMVVSGRDLYACELPNQWWRIRDGTVSHIFSLGAAARDWTNVCRPFVGP